jgi:hypothetical protein
MFPIAGLLQPLLARGARQDLLMRAKQKARGPCGAAGLRYCIEPAAALKASLQSGAARQQGSRAVQACALFSREAETIVKPLARPTEALPVIQGG